MKRIAIGLTALLLALSMSAHTQVSVLDDNASNVTDHNCSFVQNDLM